MGDDAANPPAPALAARKHSRRGIAVTCLSATSLLCSLLYWLTSPTFVARKGQEGMVDLRKPISAFEFAAVAFAAYGMKVGFRLISERNKRPLFQVTGLIGALLAITVVAYFLSG